MIPKTTYLLGAGASADALPVIANLANAVDKVFDDIAIASMTDDEQGAYKVTDGNRILVTYKDLYENWGRLDYIRAQVFEDLSANLSIDTVAKLKYTFDKPKEYNQLKAILVACFMHWEGRKGIDKRYANFWATLADARKPDSYSDYTFRGFKGNVNILSWNYDSQLEKSLSKIMDDSKWADHSKIVTKIFRNRDAGFNPFILKLNGSAKLSENIDFNLSGEEIRSSDWRFRYALASIILFPDRFTSLDNLCYSWEEETCGSSDIELAKVKCADTSTLVVIGYSFPTLNVNVDYAIIDAMSSLKRVYFQGKDKQDSINIMEHFLSINGKKKNVDYIAVQSAGFFVPPDITITRSENIPIW